MIKVYKFKIIIVIKNEKINNLGIVSFKLLVLAKLDQWLVIITP